MVQKPSEALLSQRQVEITEHKDQDTSSNPLVSKQLSFVAVFVRLIFWLQTNSCFM